jgi:Ferritin-like domain
VNHNELNQDEVRRQLREIDRANEAIMPRWRSALSRIFSGDEELSTDEKAAILGVPSPGRRDLFKMGGAAILGAAVLAACGSDKSDAKTTTPTTAAATTPPTTAAGSTPATTAAGGTPTTAAGGGNMDLVLAKTAASLEKLAVDTYGAAGALLTTAAVKDAATMFAGHHQMHLDALNAVITGAGGTAITEMNAAVYAALVKPAIDSAKTEADAVNLALKLEEAAAQTYVFAAGALSTATLRSTIMTIGGVEARHAAVLRMAALKQSPLDVFPDQRAFWPGSNPLAGIDGALITT